MSDIALIAAVAKDGVIGKAGGLPFQLSTDMKHFKALTMGHPVLMGRATYESIGRALPGRPNVVVTGDREFRAEGCEICHDLDTALDRARMLADGLGKDAVYVIGGGQIYAQTMEDADRLEITHVDIEIGADGDTHFPAIDPALWTIAAEESVSAGPKDEADMRFVTYRRAV